MTRAEYLAALKSIGLNQSEAGRFFGVTDVTGRRWAAKGPTSAVAKLLLLMVKLQFTAEYVDRVISG